VTVLSASPKPHNWGLSPLQRELVAHFINVGCFVPTTSIMGLNGRHLTCETLSGFPIRFSESVRMRRKTLARKTYRKREKQRPKQELFKA
jgi:hypothetical protein